MLKKVLAARPKPRLTWKIKILQSGYKQFEVARMLGISESRLSRFLRGQMSLPPQTVKELGAVLAEKIGGTDGE